jgi:hypothetical protein
MSPRNVSSSANQIIPAPPRALRSRSTALVARGLRDLARDSNWLIKKIFTGPSEPLALSSTGQLCVALPDEVERVVLYDIELGRPTVVLSIPGEPPSSRASRPGAFVWSSAANELIGAWRGWGSRLYAFDLHGKSPVGSFGEFSELPRHLAWSGSGRYFASSSRGGAEARVRLWEAAAHPTRGMPFAGAPLSEAGGPRSFEQWFDGYTLEAESGDESAFSGFGRIAFSPDESTLASVVEIEGEWADDSIVLFDVPTLRSLGAFQAQGHITGSFARPGRLTGPDRFRRKANRSPLAPSWSPVTPTYRLAYASVRGSGVLRKAVYSSRT